MSFYSHTHCVRSMGWSNGLKFCGVNVGRRPPDITNQTSSAICIFEAYGKCCCCFRSTLLVLKNAQGFCTTLLTRTSSPRRRRHPLALRGSPVISMRGMLSRWKIWLVSSPTLSKSASISFSTFLAGCMSCLRGRATRPRKPSTMRGRRSSDKRMTRVTSTTALPCVIAW